MPNPTNENDMPHAFSNANNNCHDTGINSFYAGVHKINESTYNSYVSEFYTTPPAPAHIAFADLLDTINEDVDCQTQGIRFEFDAANTTDNNDITFNVGAITANNIYSFQVFRGVIHLFNADAFEFTKSSIGGQTTIIFRALRGADVVYFGNLSTTFP